jgi:hypothetical protein
MAFEDIAKRMADRRKPTRGERLSAFWTGEAPEPPPLPALPAPVAPARRTRALVLAYVVLLAGMLVAMAGGFGLVLLWGSTSYWEKRGFAMVIAAGVAIIVKATRLFAAVEATAPLPAARTR